jgi:hypothetical protein
MIRSSEMDDLRIMTRFCRDHERVALFVIDRIGLSWIFKALSRSRLFEIIAVLKERELSKSIPTAVSFSNICTDLLSLTNQLYGLLANGTDSAHFWSLGWVGRPIWGFCDRSHKRGFSAFTWASASDQLGPAVYNVWLAPVHVGQYFRLYTVLSYAEYITCCDPRNHAKGIATSLFNYSLSGLGCQSVYTSLCTSRLPYLVSDYLRARSSGHSIDKFSL